MSTFFNRKINSKAYGLFRWNISMKQLEQWTRSRTSNLGDVVSSPKPANFFPFFSDWIELKWMDSYSIRSDCLKFYKILHGQIYSFLINNFIWLNNIELDKVLSDQTWNFFCRVVTLRFMKRHSLNLLIKLQFRLLQFKYNFHNIKLNRCVLEVTLNYSLKFCWYIISVQFSIILDIYEQFERI